MTSLNPSIVGMSSAAMRGCRQVLGSRHDIDRTAAQAEPAVVSADRTRSSRARTSFATAATSGLLVICSTATGSMKATTSRPSTSFRTTTLHGSSKPMSASAVSARCASGGLQAPCNVVVREEVDGQLVIAFMDPVAVLQMTSNPEVAAVAKEVRARLERVRSALTTAGST